MDLGIDPDMNLVYEGTSSNGHPLWPSPIILQAKFVSPSDRKIEPPEDRLGFDSYIFREISFDPVTRVRRGYVYHANRSTQPDEWHVNPHPVINYDGKGVDRHGRVRRRLYSFGTFSLKVTFREFGTEIPLVVLGTSRSFTIWSILSFETDTTGSELVALKARVSYGALPNLDKDSIPELYRDNVISEISTLQDDLFVAGPISVVDRCREATAAILSAYCQDLKISKPGQDIFELIKLVRDKSPTRRDIVANLADTIRIFHTRGKSAPKETREMRAVTEQDAVLAIQAVGVILCDLGWGIWN